jgi:hypothetical protein
MANEDLEEQKNSVCMRLIESKDLNDSPRFLF